MQDPHWPIGDLSGGWQSHPSGSGVVAASPGRSREQVSPDMLARISGLTASTRHRVYVSTSRMQEPGICMVRESRCDIRVSDVKLRQ